MKYIRTKDGIYDTTKYGKIVETQYTIKLVPKGYEHYKPAWTKMNKQDIINQADTIKELIDEYVILSKSCKEVKKSLEGFNETIDFILQVLEEPYDIYGAIWIKLPNGAYRLEPVAKINGKGELELLWKQLN